MKTAGQVAPTVRRFSGSSVKALKPQGAGSWLDWRLSSSSLAKEDPVVAHRSHRSALPARAAPFGRFAVLCLSPLLVRQQSLRIPPDDPRIAYTEYVCAHLGPTRASFDRELKGDWVCHQEQMSPGVRASFKTEASQVMFELEYFFAGFSCGPDYDAVPLSWEFGLEIDGVLQPTGKNNPLYPISDGATPWITLSPDHAPHDVSLIWPAGADVDLVGLRLRGLPGRSSPTLLAPPSRPPRLLGVFGDSITHGLYASHVVNTYPALVAALENWSVVNMGLAGRMTEPADALTLGGVVLCSGVPRPQPIDLLVLAIGSNDFHLYNGVHTSPGRFEDHYEDWIMQYRQLQPDVAILCITPIPRGDECIIETRTLEEYRERIREVIEELADERIYLFEGRDLVPMPPWKSDLFFDEDLLHLNDAGCLEYATNLSRFNLIRNAGFELKPLEDCEEIALPEPYLWTNVRGVSVVTADSYNGTRALSIGPRGLRLQDVYGLSEGDRFSLSAHGKLTAKGEVGYVTLQFFDEDGDSVGDPFVLLMNMEYWVQDRLHGVAPEGAVRGRVKLTKGPGGGALLLDDLVLTVAEF